MITRILHWILTAALLAVVQPAWADSSLWLVRPLYPGQEALVEKTEKALDRLMVGEVRAGTVIGSKELEKSLKGRAIDEVACFSGPRCADPTDAFVASLGFDRVVLIEGGQDDVGFKFRVTSFEPKSGRLAPASATNANLEKALLGAVAKVVPAASTLDVKTAPAGATVYIDDVKVGVTPLTTQILPGERSIRLDLKLHQPLEELVVIPIRGAATVDRKLEKVAARIVITAAPAGAAISIDGQLIGKDKVDRGILPGAHIIRMTADGHKAFEQTITVKADEQYVLDKTLEPIPSHLVYDPSNPPLEGVSDSTMLVRVTPRPSTWTEINYQRHSYVHIAFELATLTGASLVGRRFGTAGTGRTEDILSDGRNLAGVSLEYGTFGHYFGVSVFGLTYLTNLDPWKMRIGFEKGRAPEEKDGEAGPNELNRIRAHIAVIRAVQPQVRFSLWHFVLSAQAGLEFRTGQLIDEVNKFYDGGFGGFAPLDLFVSGRINAKYMIVEGLYALGSFNYAHHLIGESTDAGTTSSSSWGLQFGVGYAF